MKGEKMKKFNLFKTKEIQKELKEFRDTYSDNKKYVERQFEELKSEIFNLKHPNGLIDYSWRSWNSYLYVGVQYAFDSKIKTTRLYTASEDIPIYLYKTIIKDNYIYVGLKYEKDESYFERYFIVDMKDNKSVECTDHDIMKTVSWTQILK
jgi:hypothetical protein